MQRQHYIDALRALTMLSVVMVHLLVRGFGLNPDTSGLAVIRATFTLPLFFCVSGYFACRPIADFNLPRIYNSLKTRICALLLGSIVFDTLYLITQHKNPLLWSDGDFDSYWYTFTLLQIYVVYVITVVIARAARRQSVSTALLILLAIAGYIAHYYIDYTHYRYYWIFAPKSMEYFQFFVIGCLVRRYSQGFFRILGRPGLLTWLIIIYVASLTSHYYYGTQLRSCSIWLFRINNDLLSRYSALLLVLYIFYNSRSLFDRDTPTIRAWCRIGTRTLDIYYLHYFLIPSMRWLGPYLTKGNTLLLQLIIAIPIALIIIGLTMAIGSLIRRAPLLRLLLGRK